jgi:5-methyltetrahydrofolate--homocysteine methyltransferase
MTARAYIDAGAEVVGTNSFGGSSYKLAHYGLSDRVSEINEAAATISKEAAGERAVVIGSTGPTGKMLIMGDVTEKDLYDAFTEQIVALERGGADAVCVETMSALDEALCAIRAAKENTGLEVISTFTFERTVDNTYRTMMGVSPTQAAEAVLAEGVDVIGSNCGNGMAGMIEIVEELRAVNSSVPILVHANAGAPKVVDGETVFPETPEDMASLVPQLIKAGAGVIGGCCGTTPAHITAIAESIGKLSPGH